MLFNSPLLITSTVLTTLISTSSAAFYNSKQVQLLNSSNFKKTVQSSDKLTIASFTAPWCGHCQKLAPEYDRVADNLKGLVNIVAVDCDEEANKSFCGDQGIKGFPTIKVFPGGSAPSKPYEGGRTAKDIIDFATKEMPTFVKRATDATQLEALRAKAIKKPISLLFTSAALVTPLYKALSSDYHKTLDFYAAREVKVGVEAMKAFGVEKTPAVVILHGEEVTVYDGPLKYEALNTFLKPFAVKAKKPKAAKPSAKDEL